MLLMDCHTHTHNSPDAQADTVLSRCKRASELGVTVLAITDHCEVNRFFSMEHYGAQPNGYDTYSFSVDFEASMAENTAAKAQCPAGLTLLCGIELGQGILDLPLTERIIADKRLDFVIGSVHQLANRDDFAFLDYHKVDVPTLLHAYFEALYDLAGTDTYDVLGHLTYPLRYMAAAGLSVDLAAYQTQITEILRRVIAKGKGIEINTSGLRQAFGDAFPSLPYVKLYRELGGEILTVGSDSHCNADLAKGIPEAIEMAKAAGFDRLAYFEQHEPKFRNL